MEASNNNSTTPAEEKDLAQTPPWFMKSLEHHLDRTFDIDVCALPETAKCEIYYSLEDGNDALQCNWNEDFQEIEGSQFSYPFCYCNPPFSDMQTWVDKVISMVELGSDVVMMIPNNPETGYVRAAKRYAETIIEMPWRLKFLKPDGSPFLDKHDKPQSPKFSCLIAVFTRYGLTHPAHHTYHDFREGFYKK